MDEPNLLMRWVMFHFAGGDALFVGLIVILFVSLVPESPRSAWRWSLVTLVAVFWSGLSSPAWPWKPLLAVFSLLMLWRAAIQVQGRESPSVSLMTWCVRLVVVSALMLEFTAVGHRSKTVSTETLCVIADSITAGLNDGEQTWPRMLAEQTGLIVKDASQPGATLRSALRQAELLHDDQAPLWLEIGGNDLLSGMSVADFTRDCDLLCQRVCTPGRTVWMCELPLPPLCSRYGVVQRAICRRYGVQLIPKRRLMQILTTAGATVDSIHLSSRGQELFLQLVQPELRIEPSRASGSGTYLRCDPRRIGNN